jgi:predicted dehydrogenase/nucleoside-diphosphate-sugar epimerase
MHEKGSASVKMIRVALFGAGKMATHHAKAIGLVKNAILVAVADPAIINKNRLPVFGDDVKIFSNPDDLLDREKPDVVHICTPPETHAILAKMALRHGAHIYVEKPFSLNVQEATEVISLANEMKLYVCAGHQLLFESPTLRACEILEKFGRIIHIESYFSFNPVRRSKDGRTAISPLDQLVDILPHPVYLLLHFLKKKSSQKDVPVDISALEVNTSGSVYSILRCGDVTGSLIVTLEGRPIESYIKIVGTNGSLYADYVRGTVIGLPGPGKSTIAKILNPYKQSRQIISETTKALFSRVFKKQKSYPGLFEIISNFYNRIPTEMPVTVTDSSIIETVAICENISKKLAISSKEKDSIDEVKFHRLELALPEPDKSKGGVLITGGTGLLGKAVALEMMRRNWYTKVLARRIPSISTKIPGIDYVASDLAENISPEIFKDISVVVHCAAETDGGREAHERNSVGATRNLLQAMHNAGVQKIVHISSIAVLKTSREITGLVDENTPLALDGDDRGPYVWGKAESERLATVLSQELGIQLRIIRPGPLVDYTSFEPPGRLGREIGSLFVYVGSKSSKLSLCSIQTAAEVIRKYVENFDQMPLVLNLVEPDSPTRAELVSLVLEVRPDLKSMRIPSGFLLALSPALKLVQRLLRPGTKPLDIYAAFSSEKYNTKLAESIIQSAKLTL